ncbi:MAG: TolC family protein, partial [Leptolyngbyaceae cyanobacterium bins.302]|nr:TolC family protein [Leptolyngbyaceae cyanobacterium bins.302]
MGFQDGIKTALTGTYRFCVEKQGLMMQFARCVAVMSVSTAINLSAIQIALAERISSTSQPSAKPTLNQATQQTTPTSGSSLNPDSNPLQLPTKPDEVRLQGTQAITLQEAIALAERNNRDLQVAELTLKRGQAALRQARAALYPTLAG